MSAPIHLIRARDAICAIAPGAPGCKAAPVGGADANERLCRGCSFVSRSVQAALLALLIVVAPVVTPVKTPVGQARSQASDPQADDEKTVLVFSSGLELSAFDTIDEAPVYRARYLAPGLADETVDYASVAGDMDLLCQQDALPRLLGQGLLPQRIVVSLMSAPVEFGVMTPGVRQFFESYSVQDGLCIWEAF